MRFILLLLFVIQGFSADKPDQVQMIKAQRAISEVVIRECRHRIAEWEKAGDFVNANDPGNNGGAQMMPVKARIADHEKRLKDLDVPKPAWIGRLFDLTDAKTWVQDQLERAKQAQAGITQVEDMVAKRPEMKEEMDKFILQLKAVADELPKIQEEANIIAASE